MSVRPAFIIYLTYVIVVVLTALIAGPTPEIIGVPLNTFLLSLGLLLTPLPTWILVIMIHKDDSVQDATA